LPTKSAAEPAPRRSTKAKAELRSAVNGREHEVAGIGFIAGGVLV